MPLNMLARPEQIRDALLTFPPSSVVYSVSAAVDGLRAAGLRLPQDRSEAEDLVAEAVDGDTGMLLPTIDGTIMNLAVALDGVVLSHRLSRPEAAEDVLELDADLPGPAFMHLLGSGLTCPDGAVVEIRDDGGAEVEWADPDSLPVQLPSGTFAGLGAEAGDLVGVSYAAGVARLVRVDEASLADPDDFLAAFRQTVAGDDVAGLDEIFEELLPQGDHFRAGPCAPVSELLAAVGFAVDGDVVIGPGQTAWEGATRGIAHDLTMTYGLREPEVGPVATAVLIARAIDQVLVEAAEQLEEDEGPEGAGTALDVADATDRSGEWAEPVDPATAAFERINDVLDAAALGDVRPAVADPWLAYVLACELLDRSDPMPGGLDVLADALGGEGAAPATRAERAGLVYVQGRILESTGDPLAAEATYRETLRLVPTHPFALTALAGIAADRGQPERALMLLDQADAPRDYPLRAALDASGAGSADRTPPSRAPGRNEPCWCGSGRKYKVCHARNVTTPLPDRAHALLGRSISWTVLEDSRILRNLLMLAQAASGGGAPAESLGELAVDSLLFEGGDMAEYLRAREPLLAGDEFLLAQEWLLQRRSVFEVVAVEPGARLELRNLMDGEHVMVSEHDASRSLSPGSLVLTRVADMGGVRELFGGVFLVPLAHRDALLGLLDSEPAPADLVGWVAALYRPPIIRTPEGDALESVTSTFTTRAPARLGRQLDQLFDRDGDRTWHLSGDEGPAGTRIMGTLSLEGRTLRVNAMSRRRFADVLERLSTVEEELIETAHEIDSELDLRGTGRFGDAGGSREGEGHGSLGTGSGWIGPEQLAEHPELQAAVAEQIAAYERAWLDESIPALGGVTPRQAADDPTRRGDLIRLLDSFPSKGSPQEMDGGRIKHMLGL